MPGIPFHETRMGRDFYDRTMPRLVEQLTLLTDQLARLVAQLEAASGDDPDA